MSNRIVVDQNDDHVWPNFEWEVAPSCCENLQAAVQDDKFIFVSNFVDSEGAPNHFYMLPVNSEGYLARSNGIPISHCPWCGNKMEGKKKYPITSAT